MRLERCLVFAVPGPDDQIPSLLYGVVGATSSVSVGSTRRARVAIRLGDDGELGALAFDPGMERWRSQYRNMGGPLRRR